MENAAACGSTWQGWFAKLDLSGSLWRTPQCSFLEDLEQFSETWPRSGLMLRGQCFPLPKLELLTYERGYGYVPTPIRSDGDGGVRNLEREITCFNLRDWWASLGLGRKRQNRKPEFWEWMMGWPQEWTELKPLETDKFQEWLRLHSPSWPNN